jgi:hypothetical protein
LTGGLARTRADPEGSVRSAFKGKPPFCLYSIMISLTPSFVCVGISSGLEKFQIQPVKTFRDLHRVFLPNAGDGATCRDVRNRRNVVIAR